MRRGGGPAHVPTATPSTTGLQFPQCAHEALIQIAKHVRLSGHNRNRTMLAQVAEWQILLDNDLFCVSQDRRVSKLTGLQQFALLNVLAQFFTDKSEDPNKYAYFEVIFLGREGEQTLHEIRLNVLFKLSSYALQYPVLNLYMLITQWLAKANPSNQRLHSERLVILLVEHYIKPDMSKDMYEFLLPLEMTCPEFTVYFMTFAPRSMNITPSMACVVGSYMTKNTSYVLNQFRDTPHMATDFSREVIPKLVRYVLTTADEEIPTLTLHAGIMQIMQRWHLKVKDHELDFDVLFDSSISFSRRRCDLLISLMSLSPTYEKKCVERLSNIVVPTMYEDLLKLPVYEIEVDKSKMTDDMSPTDEHVAVSS